jgi:rRNA-processing protein FCF1
VTDETPTGIICDANVLIHYFFADKRILQLVARHIGPVCVPRPIIDDEVDQMDIESATQLGLTIIEADDALILECSTQGGPLSKHDKLLVALARNNHYICWTSDSCLKRQCEAEGIQTCWGLEMMLRLCKHGHLSPSTALDIARTIGELDKRFITPEIIVEFEHKLRNDRGERG